MRKYAFIFVMMAFYLQFLYGQTPLPIRFYPFANGSAKETVNRKDGTIHGAVEACQDRFGNDAGAMRFHGGSYITTPGFFEGASYVNGFAISFWTKIEKDFSKKKGAVPWESTDSLYRCFSAVNSMEKAMLGFSHRGDRAVLDRYVLTPSAEIENFGLWYWDPVNFTDRQGWYFVFLVYKKNQMMLYLFNPQGGMDKALHYFGLQSLEQAVHWYIGGKGSPSIVMDDFKVYAQSLTEEQVTTLYSLESIPNGMYTTSSAANSEICWASEEAGTAVGNLIGVLPCTAVGNEFTHQWIFEPVGNNPNICKIRMAYINRYLAIGDFETSQYVKLDYGEEHTEWIIEPTGDGYFFVRSAQRPQLYMKSVKKTFSTKRVLLVDNYSSADAPYFKWRFNLLKFRHELEKTDFEPNMGYELTDNFNTVFGLVPQRPFTTESSPMMADRDIYPSLSNHYVFKKDLDDSYIVFSKTFPTKALHPKERSFLANQPVELNEWHSGWEMYYKFIVERPNPLGRRIRLKPVMSQTLSVYSGDYPTQSAVVFKSQKQGNDEAHQWQAFKDKGQLNCNKQISTIAPGVYKISTLLDGRRCLCPRGYGFTKGIDILLRQFTSQEHYSSFYWVVDFERDMHGNPVKDGTYTIQLVGTDMLYIGSTNGRIPEGTTAIITNQDRESYALTKWFLTPTRDGTGSFYIQSAADKLKYLHCTNSSGGEGNTVEYYYFHPQLEQNSYKWKFERVSIPAPLTSGVYRISSSSFQVHTTNNARSAGTALELGEYQGGGTYLWNIEQNTDNTYSIYLQDGANKLYVHTEANRVDASAPLQVDYYDKEHAYSYKWLVTSAGIPNTYYLQLVGNPSDGYMHLFSHHLLYGTRLEIYKMVELVEPVYQWKIEKVE